MRTSGIIAYGPTGRLGGAYMQVGLFPDDASQYATTFVNLTPSPFDGFIQGESDWTRYVAKVDIPPGVTSAEVFMAVYQAEGLAWFDNAALVPASDVATYGYDNATHTFRTSEDTAGGRRLETTYDSRGRATESRYGEIASTAATTKLSNSTFDSLDRLTKVETAKDSTLGISAQFAYSDAGRLKEITDPLGHVTSMFYQPGTGRLDRTTTPRNTEVDMLYDGLGRLKTLTKPHASGAATEPLSTTDYDSVGRPWRTTVFGENGQSASRTVQFDKLSRATTETLVASGEVTSTALRHYDVLGRVDTWSTTGPAGDASGATTYDLANLPTRTTWNALGAAGAIDNTYAKTNQWQTTSAFGNLWTFTTSVDGAVVQVTSGLASVSRDYDTVKRLKSVHTLAGSSIFAEHTLGYDTRDRIASVSSKVSGAITTDTYGYDAADRLTGWTRTGIGADGASYDYDAAGNLITITRGAATTVLTPDTDNRLTRTTTGGAVTEYGNDLYGRRTSRTSPSATTTYTYNASGQLAAVVTPSMQATYSYGISGMREAKTVASGSTTSTTSSLWAGMQLVAERDADGTLYRYLYGAGGAPLELSVTASGGVATSYAYQLDHAGSVIGLTSATGTVVASYVYDPWGNPTSIGGTNAALAARQPLRYRGYYWDAESALYYMPARFYDPAVGRFLSVDPAPPKAGDPLSLNAYTYCVNDPVMLDDPAGDDPSGKGVNAEHTMEHWNWQVHLHKLWASRDFRDSARRFNERQAAARRAAAAADAKREETVRFLGGASLWLNRTSAATGTASAGCALYALGAATRTAFEAGTGMEPFAIAEAAETSGAMSASHWLGWASAATAVGAALVDGVRVYGLHDGNQKTYWTTTALSAVGACSVFVPGGNIAGQVLLRNFGLAGSLPGCVGH